MLVGVLVGVGSVPPWSGSVGDGLGRVVWIFIDPDGVECFVVSSF